MTAHELAQMVLAVLDRQREYFRTRNPELLSQCRHLESQLRAAAKSILNPQPATLFESGDK